MQDIVPKGSRSIRNIPLREDRVASIDDDGAENVKIKIAKQPARAPRIARKKEVTQEEIREKQRAVEEAAEKRSVDEEREREAEREVEEDKKREEEEKESLRKARDEFEQGRAKRSRRGRSSSKRGLMYLGGAVFIVVALAVLVTSIFHSATVTATPRTLAFTADADLVAKKSPAAGELAFTPLTATTQSMATVKANGQKQVSTRASGTIVIYNNYSTASQRLIKNTRFATPEGLIYRISDSVTVPGKKGTTPGSVEAVVMADEAGEKYNVGLKDFTIPGFKGDPRYNSFYARSKTPLAGGFNGIQKIVADADRVKAKSDIEEKITDDLLKAVQAKKTTDQVLYDKAYAIAFTALPDEADGDQVVIKEEGTISAVVFNREDLGAALARTYIKNYKDDPITVPNADNLTFAPKDFKPNADSVSFHISGAATFQWVYDADALEQALAGQSRSSTASILQQFPMIEKADISIRPFWSRSFPKGVDKIEIKEAI